MRIAPPLVLLSLLFLPPVATAQFRWPDKPTNLKALPDTLGGAALGQVMRGFTSALGVRCEYCHVGEGNDLAQFDFAADDKPAKQKARVMIRMVRHINGEHLDELGTLGVRPADRVTVTCMTCHRTSPKPVMLEDLLAATIDSAGLDAAVTRYRELRERYYGGFAYNFQPGTLISLGERLAGEGRPQMAIRILELELEVNGESFGAYFSLGGIQAEAGMREAAIRSFERGEAIAPEGMKRFFRDQANRLRQP